MNYTLVTVSSFSILLPVLCVLIRLRQIEPVYYVFALLMIAGFINEILNFMITRIRMSNAVNSNIYSLAEAILILTLFQKLGLFKRWKQLFVILAVLILATWIADNFIFSTLYEFSSYFTAVTSFIYVLMAVSMINKLLVEERKTFSRHPVFLICVGIILFFTCALIAEIFWMYGLDSSREFRLQVYRIVTAVNFTVNIIYTLAILWMPRKRDYILL